MNYQILALRVAGAIFGLFCLAQVLRYMIGVEVVAGGHVIPIWPSAIAALLFGGLSAWMWRSSSMHSPTA